ncbi:MAG: excinuclease ABC subunit UvrB [Desulfovibrionaceae bacterium]
MHNSIFSLESNNLPCGDQPKAIEGLVHNIEQGIRDQVLLGVTGSGKTFTVAHTIMASNRPALILAPNKTLAAQLYNEFKSIFPKNAVEYFVSYYDYYQPEAYIPNSDTYIEKDSSINENIDRLRHAATYSLLTRRDVIVIASVSCIYGLGSPEYYAKLLIPIEVGQRMSLDSLMTRLIDIQYKRNNVDFHRGTFRVNGDVLEIIPAYQYAQALRIDFFGDTIEDICEIDPITGKCIAKYGRTVIYPASHYVSDRDNLVRSMGDIRDELRDRLIYYKEMNQLVEYQRLEQKTQLDLEMMEEMGYCTGIENYSRHLDNRGQGSAPSTLLDYFPKDFLLFVDESHITIPQIGAMYKGDFSRKSTLINYGFRLPSALDNRPLMFDEFLERVYQVIYVSATPGEWELNKSEGLLVEQIIRPTGLLDPVVEVHPTKGQIDDLLSECKNRIAKGERILITTLTKRMSEDLTEYCNKMGIKTKYLHSDIDTMERMSIIQSLRRGECDAIVGINLLREGLDIPEVSLVAVLDADKEGFLRSVRSLIQTFGRAARNEQGKVILYADKITRSMKEAMDVTSKRREVQENYNKIHGITPQTIFKEIDTPFESLYPDKEVGGKRDVQNEEYSYTGVELDKKVRSLEKEMRNAASELNFEEAAKIRNTLQRLYEYRLTL